jgi:hypothetical protein
VPRSRFEEVGGDRTVFAVLRRVSLDRDDGQVLAKQDREARRVRTGKSVGVEQYIARQLGRRNDPGAARRMAGYLVDLGIGDVPPADGLDERVVRPVAHIGPDISLQI